MSTLYYQHKYIQIRQNKNYLYATIHIFIIYLSDQFFLLLLGVEQNSHTTSLVFYGNSTMLAKLAVKNTKKHVQNTNPIIYSYFYCQMAG